MRRINSIFIVLLIAIFFLTAAKMNNGSRIYSRADCKIQLSAKSINKNVELKMTITNISNDVIKIPIFLFPNDEEEFFGDWFEIIDKNDEVIDYEGKQADIDYEPEKVKCLILKPGKSHTVCLTCLKKYYKLQDGKVYTIQYLGPLGESNIVEFNYL